jgi:hypothetical protein
MEINDLYDPLGIEIFLIEESFESMFNGLKGVYFRLYYKESKRPASARNIERENAFYARYEAVSKFKRTFPHKDLIGKRAAVDSHSEEFKRMIALELSEYVTIT